MSRVLVTGGSGFIGRACVSLLHERGHEVHVVSSRPGQAPPAAIWHKADLLNNDDIERVVRDARATHLMHLAWRPAHGDVWHAADNERWVIASIELLRRFREGGGERVLGAGSCGEYDWKHALCTEDLTPLRPQTYYGACKGAVRDILLGLGQNSGISPAWARIFFVYGPGEHPGRLVANVITGLLRNRRVACTQGLQIRDYMHVADVAAGLVDLLDSDSTGVFNICSGEPTRIIDIVASLGDMIGRPDLLEIGARAPAEHEPPIILGSTDKSRAAFGFRPQWSLMQGLEDTIRWWTARLRGEDSTAS